MHQLFDMTGRVAVITGSTKGMGLEMARALGTAGAKVVVSGRSEETAKATADQLAKDNGIIAAGLGCDIADMESVRKFAKQSQEAFGRVDALVLNAAADPPVGSMLSQGPNELEATFRGLLSGNLVLVNALLPPMIERKDGSIIFMSSRVSQRGSKGLGLYSVGKAAVDSLVRNLVAEIGASNVNVNSINPGVVRTDFSRFIWEDPEAEKRIAFTIPLGRVAEAGDVAGLALLLASPAGRYITGQDIFVDGGRNSV
jgi:NAD(P)-dependent dehydrogenase (short-subunit alcohol dehydrogenase family)